MKDRILSILGHFAGNGWIQKLLEFNVTVSSFFMGIGSGGSPEFSGEKAVIRTLRKRCADGLCIFDVGANQGQFLTTVLNTLHGCRFQVHAFEPSQYSFDALRRNVSQNPNVTFNRLAIGKVAGNADLYCDEKGSLGASLTKRDLTHRKVDHGLVERVRVETLDNYCLSKNIDRIDLLKIDVEGHELDVLCGGEQMFSRESVQMVLFEFAEAAVDTRIFVKDFFAFFTKHNMRISRVTPSGFLVSLPEYNERYEQFRTTMFLATSHLCQDVRLQ